MPVILNTEQARTEWLAAGPESVEAIQSRVLSADALVIVSDDEAAPYIGGYIN